MAKLWFKFQRCFRYFRRKPVRFFTLLAIYLTAGSLVFLHSGFVGQPAVPQSQASPAAGSPVEGAELPFLGDLHLGRGFRDTVEASSIARRYGPTFKGKDTSERAKLGDYGGAWSRALKGVCGGPERAGSSWRAGLCGLQECITPPPLSASLELGRFNHCAGVWGLYRMGTHPPMGLHISHMA